MITHAQNHCVKLFLRLMKYFYFDDISFISKYLQIMGVLITFLQNESDIKEKYSNNRHMIF